MCKSEKSPFFSIQQEKKAHEEQSDYRYAQSIWMCTNLPKYMNVYESTLDCRTVEDYRVDFLVAWASLLSGMDDSGRQQFLLGKNV